MIRYLLGWSSSEERRAIEQRCLDDRVFADHLEATESELIDDYLDARLSEREVRAFEAEYRRHPARQRKVELAQALHRRFQADARRPIERRMPIGRLAGAAAVAALVAACAVYYAMRPASPFVLRAGSPSRSLESPGQVLLLSSNAKTVRLQLDLSGLVTASLDSVLLRTVEDDDPVWQETIRLQPGQRRLELLIQPTILEPRDYLLLLQDHGTTVLSYSFRIQRK